MLPYILSLTKGRLKDVCVRHRVVLSFIFVLHFSVRPAGRTEK